MVKSGIWLYDFLFMNLFYEFKFCLLINQFEVAQERLSEILGSSQAWDFQYEELGELVTRVDEIKTTYSAFIFVTLLETITGFFQFVFPLWYIIFWLLSSIVLERYQSLPDSAVKLKFLQEIQGGLLQLYIKKLNEKFKGIDENLDALDCIMMCKLINSAIYCRNILVEWGEQPVSFSFLFLFFLMIHFLKKKQIEI